MKHLIDHLTPEQIKNCWVGVDLDGTLAFYDGYTHHTKIGHPIPTMIERVKQWLTARITGHDEQRAWEAEAAIKRWCKEHIGQQLEVTCTKDLYCLELWDDRAVGVKRNVGERIGCKQCS